MFSLRVVANMKLSELVNLGFPREGISLLIEDGIETLYPPQEEAVKKILSNRNLLLSVPTASGKTLVAELAIMRNLGGKTLYIVPLRALANEKYEEFKKYEALGLKVALSTGEYDSKDEWLEDYDLIICTSEKADSLLRHGARWMEEVSLLIVDEIHLINDYSRGATLEMVISRMRRINPDVRIIGLSATIGNPSDLAEWLDAELVSSDWRPVVLREGVLLGHEVFFGDGEVRRVNKIKGDSAIDLAVDAVIDGGQSLVFLGSRRSAESLAIKISEVLRKFLGEEELNNLSRIAESIEEVTQERTELAEKLARCVRGGVAFHHAGLHPEHRRIVEKKFKSREIKVVCATPTLAAGVNLPARRVIIRDYRRYDMGSMIPIPTMEYKQMAGRAGRPKYDEYGEAVLISKSLNEMNFLMSRYVLGRVEEISSKLSSLPSLRFHVLSSIEFCKNFEELLEFFSSTFLGHAVGVREIEDKVSQVIEFLIENGFVIEQNDEYKLTIFGKRTSELYLDPVSSLIIRDGAVKGEEEKKVSEIGLLHLICSTPDMERLSFSKRDYLLMEEVDNEHLLIDPPDEFEDPIGFKEFLRSLKTGLLLKDWIKEMGENEITKKYRIGPGDLRRILETAEWLLYSTREISRLFELRRVRKISEELRKRVKYGVKRELLPLVSIRGIGRVRARTLFNRGIRNREDLLRLGVSGLERIDGIGKKLAEKIIRDLESSGNSKG